MKLHTILLQDSVIFHSEFPCHLLWNNPIFIWEDYQSFVLKVICSLQAVEELKEIRICQIISKIFNQINFLQQDFICTVKKEGYCMNCIVESINQCLKDFFADWFIIIIHISNTTLPQSELHTIRATINDFIQPHNSLVCNLSFTLSNPATSVSYSENLVELHTSVLNPKLSVYYHMFHTIVTVSDLWQK